MVSEFTHPETIGRSLRLQTLVTIRWVAVIGQTIAVLLVAYWLEFSFPFQLCLLLIACSAWLNVFLRLRHRSSHRLTPGVSFLQLSYDVLQLALLLYLTGGMQNPFAMLLVAPVVVSATILPMRETIMLGLLAMIAASVLVFFSQPLPWHTPGGLELPFMFVAGSWIAIISSLVFIAAYAFRVATEARSLANALAATELVLQREQHLSTLDGLAAAAAHELGTPLATIALVSKELVHGTQAGSNEHEDALLLRSQAERCREILQKLTSLSEEGSEHIGSFTVSSMMEEIVDPLRDFESKIEIRSAGGGSEPLITRNPAILYGLGNLVENAIDFAKDKVLIETDWDENNLSIVITDNGKGFSPELLERIGEPYISSRSQSLDNTGGGLGLGLFIAKTLLERSGAVMNFENATNSGQNGFSGARVSAAWPLERIQFQKDNV